MKHLLLTLAALALVSVCQSKTVNLELNLSKGKTYTQVSQNNFNMQMNIMGKAIDFNMNVVSRLTFHVLDVQDTVYDIEVCYDSLSMNMKLPNTTQTFNSGTNDTANMASSMLRLLKNRTFRMSLSKRGKVVDIHSLDSIFTSLNDSISGYSEEQKSQMLTQVEHNFGKDEFTTNFESAMGFFPYKPVAIGDKWFNKNTIKTNSLPIITETIYELKEITGSGYHITGVSTVSADKTGSFSGLPVGTNVDLNITGNILSDFNVDLATGWINDSKATTEIHATANIKGGENAKEVNFTFNITGESTCNGN